jgi:GINS complex subunit 1
MNLCSDGVLLVKEAILTKDSYRIPTYREDLVRNSILEIKHLTSQLKKSNPTSLRTTLDAAVENSKRCVLAYQRERLDRYMKLFWESGATTSSEIPQEFQLATSNHEAQFLKEYQALVTEWKGEWLDIDIGIPIAVSPKDVFVEIRVLQDCGEVSNIYLDHDGIRTCIVVEGYATLSEANGYRRFDRVRSFIDTEMNFQESINLLDIPLNYLLAVGYWLPWIPLLTDYDPVQCTETLVQQKDSLMALIVKNLQHMLLDQF